MKKSHTFFESFSSPLPRTDLACESINQSAGIKGTSYRDYTTLSVPVSELKVLTKEGEANTGRAIGRYVTVHCPLIRTITQEDKSMLIGALAHEIVTFTENLTGMPVSSETKVLVAGLGNRFISADSIGPRTADKVAVTGHVKGTKVRHIFDSLGCSSICAVHPGVMGQTGIEAAAMIKGAADYAQPHVIIAVDALAARHTKRLCATIQLSDTGIEPGSGIGNRRGAVKKETVGFPVIALGVPTVVDCATLVFDTLAAAGIENGDDIRRSLQGEENFFVSLKDCDAVSEEISSILAGAINRAFFTEGL